MSSTVVNQGKQMRLSQQYRSVIKKNTSEIFGSHAEIFLFGSRVDDTKKGGDIDLYIIPNTQDTLANFFDKKITFLSAVKAVIGEQKIDVVISKDITRSIEQEAMQTGIRL